MSYAIPAALALALCAGPLLAATELVVVDARGEEVLRLDPDADATGLHNLPAGRYRLKVDGPGEFELLLGAQTALEFRAGDPPAATPVAGGESSVRVDFDPDEGDQGQRRAVVEGAGDEVTVQLCAVDVPEIYGWSVTIEYDPDQLRYLSDSFEPSDFVPQLVALVDERDASVEVGGANFSKQLASGDAELGTLRFAVLDGFKGQAGLKVTRFSRRTLAAIEVMDVGSAALIASRQARAGGLDLAGAEARDHLGAENACPGCDLSGADLMRSQHAEANLAEANLAEANFSLADFSQANLADARLAGANLRLTDLRGADLRRAVLRDAKLTGAKLQKANLQGAILEGAALNGANFSGATWVDGSECRPGSIGRCK